MNLETLVERACLESGYNDTDDVTAAEKFARHWDEHIWNAALWKAALVVCDVSVDPTTNADHAEGIVFLPEVIDRVVAVRCANNQLAVRGQEHHYQMDYDAFAATGQPVEFHILSPAWFTWHYTAGNRTMTITKDAADSEAQIKFLLQDSTGRRTVISGSIGENSNPMYTLPADATSVTILSAYKGDTEQDAIIYQEEGDLLATISRGSDPLPQYARLRLLPIPTTAFTLKVLGKAKYEPLEFDQQEPALLNCTPALLAFIRGSLKRRGGEIGAAQLEFQEATALLQQVIQIEALQAANNQRFMPEMGYGPEHGLGPMGLT